MKIALLSGASSIHTVRWANGLVDAGLEVHVITQQPLLEPMDKRVTVHFFPYRGVLGYFTMVPAVKKLLAEIKPDIVNAHYASGYGTTARLVGYQPWLLSVWGSDVYDFPHTSPLHKWLVRSNLYAANAVASTSVCMAEEARKLAPKLTDIAITPFGVDMQAYADIKPPTSENAEQIVVGTVKSMASTYGIDTLIDAFALLHKKLAASEPEIAKKLILHLVGDGPSTDEYKQQANQLGIANKVEFVGRVPHTEVPNELAKLDIYVALSRIESFGVAIIEAGAAGRPVVVSDAGGLPEVTLQNKTGLIVPRENPQAAADAIEKLVLNPELRCELGLAGRKHVASTYDWPACVETMVGVYKKVVAG